MSSPNYNFLDLRADRMRARRPPWTARFNRRWTSRPARTATTN
jgi:hypothetical protein